MFSRIEERLCGCHRRSNLFCFLIVPIASFARQMLCYGRRIPLPELEARIDVSSSAVLVTYYRLVQRCFQRNSLAECSHVPLHFSSNCHCRNSFVWSASPSTLAGCDCPDSEGRLHQVHLRPVPRCCRSRYVHCFVQHSVIQIEAYHMLFAEQIGRSLAPVNLPSSSCLMSFPKILKMKEFNLLVNSALESWRDDGCDPDLFSYPYWSLWVIGLEHKVEFS